MSRIVKAERTLGPWGAGLAGYDASGKLVVVLKIKTSKPVQWARSGSPRSDLKRIQKAHP